MSISPRDAFRERERALEEEFFHRVDQELLRRLKDSLAHAQKRVPLAEATGITDEALLDELIDAGVSAESLAAITLAPMVSVAWADGKLEPRERQAILEAADDAGITAGTPAAEVLSHWLAEQPDSTLMTTWTHYVQALVNHTSASSKRILRRDVVHRTEEVAKAAKSMLGKSLTPTEKRILKQVADAFGD